MIVTPDVAGAEPKEYLIPKGKHISVHEGDRVRAGEALMDGSSNPHDILKIKGEKELAKYLVDEVQEVYRLQGVRINDKHIEVIVRQMLRRVRVKEVGRHRLPGRRAGREDGLRGATNQRMEAEGRQPAVAEPLLLGHHQGLALDRVLHLGGLLPGDDQGADRGLDVGQGRPPARPEGERDHGPPDPGGNRDGAVQRRSGSRSMPRRRCSRGRRRI